MEGVPEAARRLMRALLAGAADAAAAAHARRAGCGDGGTAAGGGAHAGASGGAGADPARRGSGGRAQRQSLWPHQPHHGRARASRSGRAHRCGAGCGADAARRRVHGARSLAEPDDDLPAGRGDGGADSRDRRGGGDLSRAARSLRETPGEALPSPGVGLRHYAPRARLVLVEAPLAELGKRAGRGGARLPRRAAGRYAAGGGCRAARDCGQSACLRGAGGMRRRSLRRDFMRGLRALDAAGMQRDSLSAAAGRGDWRGDPGPAEQGRDRE